MRNRKLSLRVGQAASSAFEQLESRRLLSAVTISTHADMTSTVKIVGTSGKDSVYIYDDPQNNKIEVLDEKTGINHVYIGKNVTAVHADMKGGDDYVKVEPISDYVGSLRDYAIDLGTGNNTFKFDSPTTPAQGVPGTSVTDSEGADVTNQSDINFDVNGESGKDNVTFDLSRTSVIASSFSINVNTEEGNDTVGLTMPDFIDDENVEGEIPLTAPEAGQAAETSDLNVPAQVLVQVDLGEGNDVMNLNDYTDYRNDGNLNVNVLGDSGNDTFNDAEDFVLSEQLQSVEAPAVETAEPITGIAPSSVSVTTDLGSGNDIYAGSLIVANPTLPTIPGGLGFEAPAVLPIQLGFPDSGISIGEDSTATFDIQGSTGNDTLKLKDKTTAGFTVPGEEGSIDGKLNVDMYGGRGNDNMEFDLDPSAGIEVSEPGSIHGVVSGDDGNDKVRLDMRVSDISTGRYDLAVQGGTGNDTVTARFQNENTIDNGANHYGARGHILVDGGSGTDFYDTEGNGLFAVISATLNESLEKPIL